MKTKQRFYSIKLRILRMLPFMVWIDEVKEKKI